MSTRAERKAENRADAARLFAAQTLRIREHNAAKAVAILCASTDDDDVAFRLGVKCGPGRAAIQNALHAANWHGKPARFEDLEPDSRVAFLCIGHAALRQWKRQAAAIERAILSGRIAVRFGTTLVSYRRDIPRTLETSTVYALVQLCATIEANLGKPRAIRITFRGPVNRQVEQTTNRLTDGAGVCPVARVCDVVPLVRAKLREYHPRGEIQVRLSPARTFAA